MKTAKIKYLCAMTLFGTIGVFVRYIPLSSATIAFFRGALGCAYLVLVMLLGRKKPDSSAIRRNFPLLLLSGAAIGFNWILLFEAYKYTSVSNATLSYYFAPVIVTVMCPILFREKLTKKQMFCFVMSTVGIVLITGVGSLGGGTDLIGKKFHLPRAHTVLSRGGTPHILSLGNGKQSNLFTIDGESQRLAGFKNIFSGTDHRNMIIGKHFGSIDKTGNITVKGVIIGENGGTEISGGQSGNMR
jgi:uncharacterized membrane protein